MQQTIMKPSEKQNNESQNFDEEHREILACSQDPFYFLKKYVWIQNRNTAKTVKWESWDYQIQVIDDLLKYKEVIILKARQLGISWLLMAYALWQVMFREAAKGLVISQGEAEAWDMIRKAKFIHEHLPEWMQFPLKHSDNRAIFDFQTHDGLIVALPSTEKAGRSTDATFVIRDELARHPYGKDNFMSIGPTIDAGGQAIDVSTIEKADPHNHFTERVLRAKNKESNAHLIFLGWKLRPVRQEGITLEQWWENQVIPKYDLYEREQEYPATIEEALSTPMAICRFDTLALHDMMKDITSPLRIEYNGWVKIYKEPLADRKYLFAIDPSSGDEDPSAGIISDIYLEKIAEFHGKIQLDEQATIIADLCKKYHKPYIAVESNPAGSGLSLIEKLVNMGVENWHYSDTKKQKHGWYTHSANRPTLIIELAEAIRLRQIKEYNEDVIEEFKSFIRTDKQPVGEARKGCHDDYVFAWAILLQIRKHMPIGSSRTVSSTYELHF